jgi:hypothetical protein
MIWVILIAVLVLGGLAVANYGKAAGDGDSGGASAGHDMYDAGKYCFGHPGISEPIEDAGLKFADDQICIVRYDSPDLANGFVSYDQVRNVLVQDRSTIEQKVTLGRILLTGVFALAWKKKELKEHSFLTIQWNDGRFDHETTFGFDGPDAVMKANSLRNTIIDRISAATRKPAAATV